MTTRTPTAARASGTAFIGGDGSGGMVSQCGRRAPTAMKGFSKQRNRGTQATTIAAMNAANWAGIALGSTLTCLLTMTEGVPQPLKLTLACYLQ